jgi:O-acetyl-ADP-ribose deacetylase (regulator of RNase III)
MVCKTSVIKGDITQLKVDAIINAANSSLLGGGGVDGAIHRTAGPQLLEECKKLNGCKTGEAKITKGYNLPAKFVIHTVGPIYNKNKNQSKLLKNCFMNSLKLAEENGCKSITFPAISCGVYRYPKKECAKIVKEVLDEFKFSNIKKVILCLYDEETKDIFEEIIKCHQP